MRRTAYVTPRLRPNERRRQGSGNFLERDLDRSPALLVLDRHVDHVTHLAGLEHAIQVVRGVNLYVVDLHDHVAEDRRGDAGICR